MNKCEGCGAVLQSSAPLEEGYHVESSKNHMLCERCFRIQHYNDYKRVTKENHEFIENLERIKKTNDLVILVVDLFHMNQNILNITKHCSKNIILVFTKRDLLPLSISNEKLREYQKILGIDTLETIIVSAIKNKGLDELYEVIHRYKKSKYVYIIGYTNAGKSTLVNHIIKNYSTSFRQITTSMLSSTTLGNIEIPIHDNLILLDTPGILEEGNICEKVDISTLKKILPKKEIKPITYQVKGPQSILIENIARIDCENNYLTFYFSNQLKIERKYQKKETDLVATKISVKEGEDIVILGLGFITVGKSEVLTVYSIPNVKIFTRKSLILSSSKRQRS